MFLTIPRSRPRDLCSTYVSSRKQQYAGISPERKHVRTTHGSRQTHTHTNRGTDNNNNINNNNGRCAYKSAISSTIGPGGRARASGKVRALVRMIALSVRRLIRTCVTVTGPPPPSLSHPAIVKSHLPHPQVDMDTSSCRIVFDCSV